MSVYSYVFGILKRVSDCNDVLCQYLHLAKCISKPIIALDLINQSVSRLTISKQRTGPVHTKFGEV